MKIKLNKKNKNIYIQKKCLKSFIYIYIIYKKSEISKLKNGYKHKHYLLQS